MRADALWLTCGSGILQSGGLQHSVDSSFISAAHFNSLIDAGASLRGPCRLELPAFGKLGIPS